MRSAILISAILLTVILHAIPQAAADATHRTPAEMERLDGDRETVAGRYPGILVTPREYRTFHDAKYNQTFHAACAVFAAETFTDSGEPTAYGRRFVVYAPDREALPLAKRVARLLLLLWGENHERMRFDHPGDDSTVNVWLTRQVSAGLSPDTAGEQFKSEIYIFDIYRDRIPAEWAREIAHEYGHYALPGVSGFKSPEEWANGVLGERLFLKWIAEDVRSGRIRPADLPFVSSDQLDTFIVLQVTPLVRRVEKEGIQAKEMEKRDTEGMDYYTGAALAVDSLYGSKMLLKAMTLTRSPEVSRFAQSPDFLRGVTDALRTADTFTVRLPSQMPGSSIQGITVFVARGSYHVTAEGAVKDWQFTDSIKGKIVRNGADLRVTQPGWYRLQVTADPIAGAMASLRFDRKGSD